ncbi:MAG: hypothetical protein AMS18_01170 [Gemmatimonas sp. SG8_17]|nr:MAG: hypothetical protein AMS18_01170 [Gemmatimonas sp. SG8_17]
MRIRICVLTLLTVALAPAPSLAQETTRADSLEQTVRALRARLDSLERVVERLIRQGRDTTRATDELAALRAAAQAAAQQAQADVDTTETQVSRTRNLSGLNPEISVTGDVVGSFAGPADERNRLGVTPREFEFSFQSALDPYTRTKIFAAYEEEFPIAGFPEDEEAENGHAHGGFHVEEAYAYWVGLPGSIGLKAGKFRQEIGLYNRWHTHALWEVDRPLPTVIFLGEDGLIQPGVGLTLPSFSAGVATQTITLEATAASNEAMFQDGGDMSFLGRFQSFWDLSPSAYVQFGATGVYGENEDAALQSRLLGLDFAFRWASPNRALYQAFHLKGEWYFSDKDEAGTTVTGSGGYAQANYRLTRRLTLGARGDYLHSTEDQPAIHQIVPSITWWQSEWLFLRAQYNYLKHAGDGANHTVLFQLVWAMGPHKHESY